MINKPDLDSTRGNNLIAAENEYGDCLIDFKGSIYRGFNLLLEKQLFTCNSNAANKI